MENDGIENQLFSTLSQMYQDLSSIYANLMVGPGKYEGIINLHIQVCPLVLSHNIFCL